MTTRANPQSRDAVPPSFMPGRGLLLQRKCACGSPSSSLTGECAECKSKKFLKTKFAIGASKDQLDQEADWIADQVLAAPPWFAVSIVHLFGRLTYWSTNYRERFAARRSDDVLVNLLFSQLSGATQRRFFKTLGIQPAERAGL